MSAFSEQELAQQIVTCTPDGVIFADRGGIIRFWNAGAEAIFGYPAQEVIGQPLELIVPEQLRARHNDGYRRVMQTGVTQYSGRRLLAVPAMRKDGERISVEFSIALLHNESGTRGGTWMEPATQPSPESRRRRGAGPPNRRRPQVLGVAAVMRDVTDRWRKEKGMAQRLAALEAKSK